MNRHLLAIVIAASGLCAACEPTFKPEGSLSVDGAGFTPTTCHVLTSGGIELVDAAGARLELALAAARLDAFKDLAGNPIATYTPAGGKPATLGECGTITLTGEGYHDSGKRAVSGKLSLACEGGAKLKGDMSFTGCF